jgi:hypothetical protein
MMPADFLAHAFREGEKVVTFTNQMSQGQALWPLQEVPQGGDEGVWYLAQPVDGKEHPNPRSLDEHGAPKMSRRSEESVTSWRHLVLESDQANARDWMGALVQLPLRVVAIYTSGGRSVHVLVDISAPTKAEWDNIMKQLRPVLVTLGADPKAMSAVRLSRLPGCMRGDRLQKLLYLNPTPDLTPICALPKVQEVHGRLGEMAKYLPTLLAATPREVEEQGQSEFVYECESWFAWFSTLPAAAEALGKLREWKGGHE